MLRFVGLVRRIAAQGGAKGVGPAALQSARIDVLQFHPGKEKDQGHNLVPQSHHHNPKSGRRGLPRSPSKLVRPLVKILGRRGLPRSPSKLVRPLVKILGCRGLPRSPSKLVRPLVKILGRRGLPRSPSKLVRPLVKILGCRGLPHSPSKLVRPLVNYSSLCSRAQIV
jgi:hypothetical protein